MANTKSIRLKTKELLRFHSGCYGNQVNIARMYLADALPSQGGSIANVSLTQLKVRLRCKVKYIFLLF